MLAGLAELPVTYFPAQLVRDRLGWFATQVTVRGAKATVATSLARWLRTHSRMGIIFATAADQPVDRIVGLELGADDYITKPYELRELLARLQDGSLDVAAKARLEMLLLRRWRPEDLAPFAALNGDAAQGPAPGHVSDGAHNRATGYVNQRQSVFSEIRNNRHELPVW